MRVKQFKILIFLVFALAVLTGCEETNELIDLQQKDKINIDSTWISAQVPSAQDKITYVEEGTGVKCKNCPTAQEELERIEKKYLNKVAVVALHCDNTLSRPFSASKYEFRTPDAFQILSIIGTPPSLPLGSVNRLAIAPDNKILNSYTTWSNLTDQDQTQKPKANIILLNKGYDAANRFATFQYRIEFTQVINKPVYFTALMTESGMIDLQETNVDIDSNYVHKHVLRKTVDAFTGIKLADNFVPGQTFLLSFTTSIDSKWREQGIKIVSILNFNSLDDKVVLQAHEDSVL
ncbi:MAG: Omp28-related outer membrane protein [Bacteroidota bacterium]|nr:Omp28-related outer membrane protein [Bacteroidota bacterium]